jgi:hypothetical protein
LYIGEEVAKSGRKKILVCCKYDTFAAKKTSNAGDREALLQITGTREHNDHVLKAHTVMQGLDGESSRCKNLLCEQFHVTGTIIRQHSTRIMINQSKLKFSESSMRITEYPSL